MLFRDKKILRFHLLIALFLFGGCATTEEITQPKITDALETVSCQKMVKKQEGKSYIQCWQYDNVTSSRKKQLQELCSPTPNSAILFYETACDTTNLVAECRVLPTMEQPAYTVFFLTSYSRKEAESECENLRR